MRKNKISETISRMNKQKENNSKTYINDKNIENNTQAPKTSTTANNRYTAENKENKENRKQGRGCIYNYGLKLKVYMF